MVKKTSTLPSNPAAERAVLGSVLVNGSLYHRIADMLKAADFFNGAHAVIWQAFKDLTMTGKPIDLVTLIERLTVAGDLNEAGGLGYISALADELPDPSNIEHYAGIVHDAAIRRSVLRLTVEVASHVGSTSAPDLIEELFDGAMEASGALTRQYTRKVGDVVHDAIVVAEEIATKKRRPALRPTGFASIDAILGGMGVGDLDLLAARPGVGKTSLAVDIAINVAMEKHPVLFCSLEMSSESIGNRIASAVSGIPLRAIRNGFLKGADFEKLADAEDWIAALPLYIDDAPGQTVTSIGATARRLRASQGLALVVIDYLQLIHFEGRFESRNVGMGSVSSGLKELARTLSIPVLALSQLSRPVKGAEEGRMPNLEELRDSGSLEQDADAVIFLARKASEGDREVRFKVAKHRNGPVGDGTLIYVPEKTTFRGVN